MKIYKYELDRIKSEQSLRIPINALVISAAIQKNRIVVYCCIDYHYNNTDSLKEIKFFLAETGQNIPIEYRNYLATLMFDDGEYVLHVLWQPPY